MTAQRPRSSAYSPSQGERDDDVVKLAVMQNDISYIKDAVKNLDVKMSSHYVSNEEFEPIKKIVYGLVGLILVGVVGAVVSLVIKK